MSVKRVKREDGKEPGSRLVFVLGLLNSTNREGGCLQKTRRYIGEVKKREFRESETRWVLETTFVQEGCISDL